MTERRTQWRADIDGLRAIAVLSVVVYHALPAVLPGGFVGVDVFFVISGYLITGILLVEHRGRGFSLLRFYERRARRLFPALATVLAVTCIVAFAIAHPRHVVATAKESVAAAISLANVAFWRNVGYFDTGAHFKPLLNLWSLGVEEQFYLVWPLLLAAMVRSRHLVVALGLVCASSFALAEALNTSHRAAVFYLPMFRVWELGFGAWLAVIVDRGWTSENLIAAKVAEVAVALGVAMIVATTILLDVTAPFPGVRGLGAIGGTGLLLWAGTRQVPLTGLVSRALASRPAVWVGLLSYSLYLWHWPLLTLPVTAGISPNAYARIALVAVAFILSIATVRWIEQPARQAAVPVRAAILSCAGLVAAVCIAGAVYFVEAFAGRSPARQNLAAALAWPSSDFGRDSCPQEILQIKPRLAYCRRSNASAPTRIVVWGDSHADHLFPGLVSAAPQNSWLLLGHQSCPPTLGIDVLTDEPECRSRAEQALAWIERQRDIDTVLVSFFGHYGDDKDVAQQHRDGPMGPSRISIDGKFDRESKMVSFTKGIDAAIARLLAARKRVVVVADVPELPFAPTDCFMRPRIPLTRPVCAVTRAAVDARQSPMRRMLDEISARHPEIVIVDPKSVMCGETKCGPGDALRPLYRDSHHLSLGGSAKVAQLIVDALRPISAD